MMLYNVIYVYQVSSYPIVNPHLIDAEKKKTIDIPSPHLIDAEKKPIDIPSPSYPIPISWCACAKRAGKRVSRQSKSLSIGSR